MRGVITPWNWPLSQITVTVARVMGAGCTVVLKPSKLAPLSALLFARVVADAGAPRRLRIQTIMRAVGVNDLRDGGAVAQPPNEPACTARALARGDTVPHKADEWECTVGRSERQMVKSEVVHNSPTGVHPLRIFSHSLHCSCLPIPSL